MRIPDQNFLPSKDKNDLVTDTQLASALGKTKMTLQRWRHIGYLPQPVKILGVNHTPVGLVRKSLKKMLTVDKKALAMKNAAKARGNGK